MSHAIKRVRALPIWKGDIDIEPLEDDLRSESFKVTNGEKAYVVRLGEGRPSHHVSHEREAMTASAAAKVGIAPALVHAGPDILVLDHIDGTRLKADDVIADIPRIADLVRRCHQSMPREMRGPGFMFWPFHVIRDYADTLKAGGSRMAGDLSGYLDLAEELERVQTALPIVFGHNDLLPGNLLDDGQRLWLMNFDHGGFSTAMVDLAGLAWRAGFDQEQSGLLLALYFGRQPEKDLVRSHAAMQCALLLLEAMKGMVSERPLDMPGVDAVAGTKKALDRLAVALDSYHSRFGRA